GGGQDGDAEKERAEDALHPAHGDGGVTRLRRLEGGPTVRDRLDPREGRAAGGERAQHEKPGQRDGGLYGAWRQRRQVAVEPAVHSRQDQRGEGDDGEIGGAGEDPTRLAGTAA